MVKAADQKTEWLSELIKTDTEFINLLSSFSQTEVNIHPGPGSWSAGQVTEHIHKSDKGIIRLLSGTSKKEDRAPDQMVETIKSVFLNFDSKLDSPGFIIPEDKIYEKDLIIARFESERKTITEIVRVSDLSETCTAYPFPGFGEITRLEILSFIVSHTQRHINQLRRIAQKIKK